MAMLDPLTGNLKGKLGGMVFQVRHDYNYARKHVIPRDPKTPKQLEHRAKFGRIQHLGSLWTEKLIRPYLSKQFPNQNAYNKFVSHNYHAHGDKEKPELYADLIWNSSNLLSYEKRHAINPYRWYYDFSVPSYITGGNYYLICVKFLKNGIVRNIQQRLYQNGVYQVLIEQSSDRQVYNGEAPFLVFLQSKSTGSIISNSLTLRTTD